MRAAVIHTELPLALLIASLERTRQIGTLEASAPVKGKVEARLRMPNLLMQMSVIGGDIVVADSYRSHVEDALREVGVEGFSSKSVKLGDFFSAEEAIAISHTVH